MQHMDSLLVARNRSILGQVFKTTSIPPTGKPSSTIFTCIPSVRSKFSLCSVFTRNVSMTKWFEILIDIDMDTHVSVLKVLDIQKKQNRILFGHLVSSSTTTDGESSVDRFLRRKFALFISIRIVFHSQSPNQTKPLSPDYSCPWRREVVPGSWTAARRNLLFSIARFSQQQRWCTANTLLNFPATTPVRAYSRLLPTQLYICAF